MKIKKSQIENQAETLTVDSIPNDGMYLALVNKKGNIVGHVSKIEELEDKVSYMDNFVNVRFSLYEPSFCLDSNIDIESRIDWFGDFIDGLSIVVKRDGKTVYKLHNIDGKTIERKLKLTNGPDPIVEWSVNGFIIDQNDDVFDAIIGNRSYVMSNILKEYGDRPYTGDECLCFSSDIHGFWKTKLMREFDLKEGDNLFIIDDIELENGWECVICWNKCTKQYVIVPKSGLNKYGLEKTM